MQEKKRVFGGLSRYLDIPSEALPGGFGLSLSGRRELTARGCRRILSYGTERISLLLGGGAVLAVEGDGLLCTVFRAGCVTVEGRITALRFEKEDSHEA